MKQESTDLIAGVPSADQRFQDVYNANLADVRGFCRRRLDHEDADDAVVETFLVAWRRIDDMPAGTEARLWLFGVARNVVAHQYRSHARSVRLRERLESTEEVDERDEVEASVLDKDRRARVLGSGPKPVRSSGSVCGRD